MEVIASQIAFNLALLTLVFFLFIVKGLTSNQGVKPSSPWPRDLPSIPGLIVHLCFLHFAEGKAVRNGY
ncbi:hypothetical protein [Salinivibrio sp. ML290]|uniref:hypothetical protein n=1 Tax=Salinivibrio sp. ML290 TaxID=1909468 RepID=UPI0010550675|nr:hypothetical protein [Salinivibrio sp. ML290]